MKTLVRYKEPSNRSLLAETSEGAMYQIYNEFYPVPSLYLMPAAVKDTTASEFKTLVENWKKETAHLSLISQQTSNINFLKILVLGKKVLPLIFKEFKKLPVPGWLTALQLLTDADPAANAENYGDAVQCWLDWGIANGYSQR